MDKLYNSILNACKIGLYESLEMDSISCEEAREDYEALDWADNSTKKELAIKYNIDSKKAKEIQHAILLYLRNLRNKKSEFMTEDERDFNRLTDLPSRYDKAAAFYKEESRDFLNYLLNIYKPVYEEIIRKRGNYGLSNADKYRVDRYKNLTRFLEESNPNSVVNQKKNEVDIIVEKLNEQLTEFKKYYLDNIKKAATTFYNNLDNLIIEYKENREDAEKSKIEYSEKYKAENGSTFQIYYDKEYTELRKKCEKLTAILDHYRAIKRTYLSVNDYVNKELENGENAFNGKINALASRINEKQLNVQNLEVSNINYDPKLFEMFITDGNKKLYARSIWAAETSDYMVAHFRFIITNA